MNDELLVKYFGLRCASGSASVSGETPTGAIAYLPLIRKENLLNQIWPQVAFHLLLKG